MVVPPLVAGSVVSPAALPSGADVEGIRLWGAYGRGVLHLPRSLPHTLRDTPDSPMQAGSPRGLIPQSPRNLGGASGIRPAPLQDVMRGSSPPVREREVPGAGPRRRSSQSPERRYLLVEGGAGEAKSLTHPSPPASTTGEVGSPARPSSTRSGTPTSTHNSSETQTRSMSGFAGSAPVSPSSGAWATPTDEESSNASTTSTPSSHDMRVMDGVLEDLIAPSRPTGIIVLLLGRLSGCSESQFPIICGKLNCSQVLLVLGFKCYYVP